MKQHKPVNVKGLIMDRFAPSLSTPQIANNLNWWLCSSDQIERLRQFMVKHLYE